MAIVHYTPSTRATANSYGSVSDAKTYFDLRLDTEAWTDAAADMKSAALATAVRLFERLPFEWLGDIANPDQSMQWPRSPPTADPELEVYDELPSAFQYKQDAATDNWKIPERIKHAQFEQALHMLANEGILLADAQPAQISLGELSLTNPGRIDIISGLSAQLLSPYVADSGVTSFAWGNDGYPLGATSIFNLSVSGVSNASVGR